MERWCAILLLVSGCGAAVGDARVCSPRPIAARVSPNRPTIVLVTIDGARAIDVLDGARMPNLRRLAERIADGLRDEGIRDCLSPLFKAAVKGKKGKKK